MKYISDILREFSAKQRVMVLVILLFFSSGTYIAGVYLKDSNCSALRGENISLQKDFMQISKLLHEEQAASVRDSVITFSINKNKNIASKPKIITNEWSDIGKTRIAKALEIVDKHIK